MSQPNVGPRYCWQSPAPSSSSLTHTHNKPTIKLLLLSIFCRKKRWRLYILPQYHAPCTADKVKGKPCFSIFVPVLTTLSVLALKTLKLVRYYERSCRFRALRIISKYNYSGLYAEIQSET